MLRAGLLLVLLLCTAGCGGAGQPVPYDATGIDGLVIPTPSPDPADFVEEVDNPWLPLAERSRWSYVIEQNGEPVGKMGVRVTGVVDVAGLASTVVRTVTRVRGAGRAQVDRYYAQDVDGNVWLVGEDTEAGQWRAEEDHPAGLAMPAEPRIGDAWVRVEAPPVTETVRVVEDPVGEDPDTVTLEQVETGTRTTYEAGTGPVLILDETQDRTIELVD